MKRIAPDLYGSLTKVSKRIRGRGVVQTWNVLHHVHGVSLRLWRDLMR